MENKYYLDTSIWIDVYEDRKGYNNEPLGEYGLKLLALIKAKENKIIISDLLISELEVRYTIPEINGMLKPFEKITEKIFSTTKQKLEAKKITEERKLPYGDALHSIIARDNNLILITRDKHFKELTDISKYYKPEELI